LTCFEYFGLLSFETANQNMGTIVAEDTGTESTNSSFSFVEISKVSACKCLILVASCDSLIGHLKWKPSAVVKKMSQS